MDLESVFRRLPFVYTTRLEEMAIFRKDFSNTRSLDIINSIIAESKPIYRMGNIKQEFDKDETKQQHDNEMLSSHQERKPNLTFEKLKEKVNRIKTNNRDKQDFRAICRPLKVVLEDISKISPILNDEIKREVISISSDSEDDVVIIGQDLMMDKTQRTIVENNPTNKNNELGPTSNHIIKNINDFKDILKKEDLKNSVLVIYNLYNKELDAYQIGKCYNVIEYKTWKYSEVYKFPMKKCKLIINIIACCWKNRQAYELLLKTYRKYYGIYSFICSTHPCKKRCICCCFFVEQSSSFQDNVNNTGHVIKYNNRLAILEDNSKFIVIALKFQKNTKWKGYPAVTSYFSDKNDRTDKRCHRLLQLSNAKGEAEYYELGSENEIYSKLIINGTNNTNWLSKTVAECPSRLHYKFTDSVDREKQIISDINLKNIISLNTQCFLREPVSLYEEEIKKSNCCSKFSVAYKIEHKRSFMVASNKKSKVISVLSPLRGNDITVCHNVTPTPRSQIQIPKIGIMEQDVSQTINNLIKDILHRFRNVFLTINSEGRVAAALNSQLSSLTSSELEILSQILSHAQSQVDKLGLRPGTCLNPDTPLLINSDSCKTPVVTTVVSNFDNLKQKIQASKDQRNYIRNNILLNLSKTIGHNKIEYEKSFRTYLGDKVKASPKITNVFTLNNSNSTSSDYVNPNGFVILGGNDTMNDSSVSTVIENNSNNMLTTVRLNDIKEEITIVENEIESMLKERKRKTSLDCNFKPPKIRVRTAEEIVNVGSVPLVSPRLENPQLFQPESLTLTAKSDLNYVSEGNQFRVLGAEPKEINVMADSHPHQVLQRATMPVYEIHADGTSIETKNFPII